MAARVCDDASCNAGRPAGRPWIRANAAPGVMRVVRISEADDAGRCDAYLAPRAHAVTDLPAWRRVVGDACGLRAHVLAALETETIVGLLSLFEIRHPVFGHYLCTAPFGNDGGLHFDDDRARDALVAEARSLTDALDAEYLVIRTRGLDLDGFRVDHRYATAVVDLSGGASQLWDATLPAKTRNQIRRGMKEGFSVDVGHAQAGALHDVLHAHMRDLGSPAHGMRFYESIIEHVGDAAEFIVVRDGRKLAAGALLFRVNGVAMNLHTVALRKYNPRCPNYLIYWRMIEDSCASGCRLFDMGRSIAHGPSVDFKRNWGPEIVPLSYNYFLRTAKEVPHVDPRNPKYRLAIAAWRRLPLFVTTRLGPRLISGLA